MVHACSIPLMPDAQLAAYGVGIIALIGGIATVARGFRADVEKIVDGKLEAVFARLSALDKALSDEREERRRMEREK